MSALTRKGSTRRWRRLRFWVLGRDAAACQVPAESGPPPTPGSWAHQRGHAAICGRFATHVDHADRTRAHQAPGAADDPADLRACCAAHNLSKGARSAAEFDPTASTTARPSTTRWEW